MPLSTEHQGICEYSTVKKVCDMPATCAGKRTIVLKDDKVCPEMPIVRHVGKK